jgi:hypothetical protein
MSQRWYCSLESGVWGPADVEQVEEILRTGHLHKATWVRREDGDEWIALADAGLFPVDSIPDPPDASDRPDAQATGVSGDAPPAESVTQVAETVAASGRAALRGSRAALSKLGGRGQQALEAIDFEQRKKQARDTFNLYRLFWTRVLKSDFSVVRATADEKRRLTAGADPVESPLAQDYASWRRSLLMICILVLGISTFFNITDIWAILSSRDTHVIRKIQTALLFLFQFGSVVLCALAAWNWGELRRSRSLARFAWLTQFVGPFLVFLAPLSLFIDEGLVLFQLGLAAVVTLAPKIFGLFPGLIRCSLTVKTLLPETSAPGWLGIIIAPFYLLFLAVGTIAAIQMSQLMLGIGLGLLAAQMGVVVWQARRLLHPCEQAQASSNVKAIKRTQLIFQIAGVSCIAIFLYRIGEFDWVWFNSLVLFVFSFVGNVTLLTVVMSDFMLGMIRQGQLQAEAFAGTPLSKSLAARLDDLASCGLTDLEAGEAAFAGRLKGGGGVLARAASSRGSKLLQRARRSGSSTAEAPQSADEDEGGDRN